MNDAMKKLPIPVAVILVAALVLFAATAGLAGTASANEQAKLDEILGYMIPGGGEYAEEEYTGSNSNITGVYRGEEGVVVEMVVGGFANDIHMLVAVRNDGTVTGVSILDSHETYGLGQEAKSDWDFLIDMLNSQGDLAVNSNIDSITGATITSSAVVSAVNAASQFVLDSAAASGPLTGTADGFMGPITVEVTMDGDTITGVTVVSNSESAPGTALEDIPAAIVAANSPDVDIVAGATYTSNGIINAVKNAISGSSSESAPAEEDSQEAEPEAVETAEAYQGFGLSNTVRMGPGEDDTGTPVYSINQVFANVIFDGEGKILEIYVDQLEYATPNYDGAEMPHFSGWPGQGGYNNDSDHDAVVDGVTPDTEEQFTSEVEGWVTKRDRGDTYVMGTGTWHEQMDAFQELFIGMTVDEVQEWFDKYCSDANGRPLKEGSEAEGDAEKYAALSDEEKEMLVDVTSSATMSLNDSHGNILAAIVDAYENRIPLQSLSASGMGFGLSNTVRMGPGEDDTGTPVYSINQVFANTLFDDEGRIVAIYVDQLEYATPNYDGAEMPHFSGWPGQGGYNNDSDHDAVVDGVTPDTEEQFTSEVEGWVTKRDRGDTYVMGTGTWHEQMDAFQELFIGMTVDEVQEWFDKYCSDANGRPLKEGSEAEGDAEKYAALSDEEKEMLVDVTSSATMSLNDSHGNILAAILDSFEDQVPVDITVG